jgi:hypothetical protein
VKLSAWQLDYHPEHGTVARITSKGLRIGPLKPTLEGAAVVENPGK